MEILCKIKKKRGVSLGYADFGKKLTLNVPTDNLHFSRLPASIGCTYKTAQDELSTSLQSSGRILHILVLQ
jgi:hypothetical protein